MDDLEASVGWRLDEVSGSARPKPNDKQKALSESDKGNQSGEKRPRCSTGPNSEPDLSKLSAKIDKLTNIVGEIVPVVHQLKMAYDDEERSRGEIEGELFDDDGAEDDHQEKKEDDSSSREPAAKRQKLELSQGGIVDSLVLEVTDAERTATALPDKIASVLDYTLSTSLNDQAAASRKEQIRRPDNCKLLSVTKVNQEIWDIAHRSTRSMDSRL